jgi:hypothetical protein
MPWERLEGILAVLKPRERLVYFRVSEDEFRQFVSVCEQGGARSVSDLARSAVQRLIADGQRQREDTELDEKMRMLERLIAAVTEQLNLLAVDHARVGPGDELASRSTGFFPEATPADQNGRREK